MKWNYRIIKRMNGDEEGFAIHEVYYKNKPADNQIEMWSVDPIAPHGETLDELIEDIEAFRAALDKPVLNEGDLLTQIAERMRRTIKTIAGRPK